MFIEVGTAVSVKQARSEPRMKVLLAGELSTPRGPVPCRLLDISRGGACVDLDQPQPAGTEVALTRGPLSVKGRVAWAQGRRCGVTFEDPIRATDLFVQMSASRLARSQPETRPVSAPRIPST